jgi:lipopolysaccharide/colanic/teichoic acid biosynthesis glycosyltransferase
LETTQRNLLAGQANCFSAKAIFRGEKILQRRVATSQTPFSMCCPISLKKLGKAFGKRGSQRDWCWERLRRQSDAVRDECLALCSALKVTKFKTEGIGMVVGIAARLQQDNVAAFPGRRPISIKPVECGSRRGRYYSRGGAGIEPYRSVSKRIFDIVIASGTLIFLAPVLLAIAVAIRITSRGPALFFQYRYGYRNRRFKIYKFRTMRVDACDRGSVKQAVKGDTRVTWIGRILRKTSLDEIPQLVNVIKGEMSLVGPRPHVPGLLAAELLYEDLIPYYFQRHTARPGITGLAQVSGCRGSTVEAGHAISRIDYDLEYIEKWSLGLDIMIILRTIRREFLSGSGF